MQTLTPEERNMIAANIEQNLQRAAGCVRNRIREGMSFEDACQHESVTFWTDYVEKEAKKLRQ